MVEELGFHFQLELLLLGVNDMEMHTRTFAWSASHKDEEDLQLTNDSANEHSKRLSQNWLIDWLIAIIIILS